LCGHFDKVSPAFPDQVDPVIEGHWLHGRGAADMLTVAATYMQALTDLKAKSKKNPGMGLLLVGNEEGGEADKWGTAFVLDELKKRYAYQPQLMIVGERTGAPGNKHGKVELKNRGLVRLHVEAMAKAEHTADVKGRTALDSLLDLKDYFEKQVPRRKGKWRNGFIVSYLHAGRKTDFNTTPIIAECGFEVRPIPETDIRPALKKVMKKARQMRLSMELLNSENGVKTSGSDPRVKKLLAIIADTYGKKPSEITGNGKTHGTQARFCPEGTAQVIFGQSGEGPHTDHERHYIPSIMPYYKVLIKLPGLLQTKKH
jgi:acetylornithine deacetylase/succinyl-diaminopimelate desuccinylase-like protein